jgi:hypothetical protein
VKHEVHAFEDAAVRKSQDGEAEGAEDGVPIFVMSHLSSFVVDTPVELHHETQLVAAEIGDETFDRELAPKLQAEETPTS